MIAAESGLDFTRFDDISGKRRILETNGGGAGLADFDRDGWLDVFLTNGCRIPCRADDRDTPSALFRNRGEMRFERISVESGLLQYGYAHGCAVGDYNADGFEDLYVTAQGPNTLWLNNGDGTFTDVTGITGTAAPQWSSSAAFSDVNDDGALDLYVVNYLDESDEDPRLCPNPASPDGYEGCSPALFEGVADVLYFGDGSGGFVDATRSSGIAGFAGKGLGVVIGDLDRSGSQEIYVANDGEANSLFVRSATSASRTSEAEGVQYTEQALLSGVALNERGYAQASMGIAAGDIDGNGLSDLFLTHFYGDTNTLYLNDGGLNFHEGTRGSGLGASSRQTLGFGTVLIDFDNDGWLDLFVANGHVDDRTWTTPPEPYAMPPQMYRNERDASFSDVSRDSGGYFRETWLGRGVASGDLDRDGRVDLVVSHQLAPSMALRNESDTSQQAVVLRLAGTVSERSGYGVRVEVESADPPVVRELLGGTSYQSAPAREIHLGLAGRESATIELRWPSGTIDRHAGVRPGHWMVVEGGPLLRLSAPTSPAGTPQNQTSASR